MKDLELIGSSPEVMVKVDDGNINVRPIAGTRRRGLTTEEDELLANYWKWVANKVFVLARRAGVNY